MENIDLERLLYLYVTGKCTLEEKNELARIVKEQDDNTLKNELSKIWDNYKSSETLSDDRANQILANIFKRELDVTSVKPSRNKKRFYFRVASIAASVLIILGGLGFHLFKDINSSSVEIKAHLIAFDSKAPYVRNIKLPDGTSVVLQAFSTIQLPKDFNNKIREITLVGKAYFDVKHNADKPFIIHSGRIKTTVLGTAFCIEAWPEQRNISVIVTRGKVKVEDPTRTLAILTINQEVKYNTASKNYNKQNTVSAEKIVTDWTKQDMDFNAISLDKIAKILSKRYGRNITISNNELANTLFVASFSGTESLENVLTTLCEVSENTHYRIENNNIIIL
jgi:transmembrane sensor